ncbi:MAG: hypothetical protein LBF33_00525 [Oscillospiraceae bacterium]|nr:hypothetical protein [Oscillospiraceae bacterium]
MNVEERQFRIRSYTGINGVWPPWDLPKFCRVESCISNGYEHGSWQNHYVRCYLGDYKHDTGRQGSCRIMDGAYAGWYAAEAQANGSCSDGTGYSFYGRWD